MREKIILTDVDGVLLYWAKGFHDYMVEQGLAQLPDTDHEYSVSLRHGVTPEVAKRHVEYFNNSPHIATLEPFQDAVEYVDKLSKHGFRFIAITSLSNSVIAYTYRTANLKSIFGDVFDRLICLSLGADKYETLKEWEGSKLFWIEDHINNAEAGHKLGLKSILIEHEYNKWYERDLFPKVSFETPWAEIYKIVCKEYNIV